MPTNIIGATGNLISAGVVPVIVVDLSGNYVDVSTSGTYGDVDGPSSARDNSITVFNGTTGKILKDTDWTVVGNVIKSTGNAFISGTTGLYLSASTGTATLISDAGIQGTSLIMSGSAGAFTHGDPAGNATVTLDTSKALLSKTGSGGNSSISATLGTLVVAGTKIVPTVTYTTDLGDSSTYFNDIFASRITGVSHVNSGAAGALSLIGDGELNLEVNTGNASINIKNLATGPIDVTGNGNFGVLTPTITMNAFAGTLTQEASTNMTQSAGNGIHRINAATWDVNISGNANISADYPTFQSASDFDIYAEDNLFLWTDNATLSIEAATHLDLSTIGGNIRLNSQGGNILIADDVLATFSGTASIGTVASPFSGVYANNYGTTRVSGAVSAAVHTVNWNNGASQILTWANGQPSGVSILFSGATAGSSYVLETVNNASGTSVITWPSSIKWQSFMSGVSTASNGAVDLFTFYYNGTNFLGNAGNNYK